LFLWWSLGFPLFLGLLRWSPPRRLLWNLGFTLFLELLLWSLLWSLGFHFFLELLPALAMLQGSHFLFLVHISRVKSRLRDYSSILHGKCRRAQKGKILNKNQKLKVKNKNDNSKCKNCRAGLKPRARVGWHDLLRSRYNYVWNLDSEIATLRSQ